LKLAASDLLIVDLGQSGSRFRIQGIDHSIDRGNVPGESVIDSLRTIFELIPEQKAGVVSLACTAFNGAVPDPAAFAELSKEFFSSTKCAVIDDGLAGFIGGLNGKDGVVLSIGGGVVSVGGNNSHFAHRDGLGSVFGDEGGGYWLGKLAITKALGIRQGRGGDQEFMQRFTQQLKVYDQIQPKNAADASILAISTGKILLEAADDGLEIAVSIRNEGAFLLAQTVIATWLATGGTLDDVTEIAIRGGLSKNANYVKRIQENILAKMPQVKFVAPRGDNLDGATWIAENMLHDAAPLLRWASN